ncbi:MAG: methyltransferase domain-containing protein, partial [Dehalococcoidales bacterium]|nr:methyltransferase domain-containing protein [Dehalococcoidales bacterium]
LDTNPDFQSKVNAGYHYIQMPSRLSRFYMRETVAWLKEHYASDIRILDFGNGVGTSTAYYYSQGFHNIEGMDSDGYLVTVANKLYQHLDLPIKSVQVDREDVYQMRGQWDVILIQDLLYYLPDLPRVIESFRGVLTRYGSLVFDLLDYEVPPNKYRHYDTPEEVKALLEAHGYRLRGMSILDQLTSRKTSYYAEMVDPRVGNVLAPGNQPYV